MRAYLSAPDQHMPETHPFLSPSFRGQNLTAIDHKRRAQGLGYNQLAIRAGLDRHVVVKALVGHPTGTDFPTLMALATAVGHDLQLRGAGLATAS
jgi:DNA-binding phage protein